MKLRWAFAILAVLGAGTSLLFAPAPPSPCVPTVPCGDPRGCPDLRADPRSTETIVFVTRSFAPDSCSVLEGHVLAGVRRLMSFDTYLPNLGAGDLLMGGPSKYPNLFEYATCHGHYHMKSYAAYRLWTLDGYARWRDLRKSNPDICSEDLLTSHKPLAREMIQGRKTGFCLADVEEVCGRGIPSLNFDCGENQGLTAGWTDIYGFLTESQWIDITDVAPGQYVFETEVNPLRIIMESNYLDNAVAKIITVPAP